MKYKDFFKEDLLPGGKGDTPPSNIDPNELKMGIKVEKEHTHDDKLAREIATDHLKEDPHYYSKLNKAGLADELGENQIDCGSAVVEPNTQLVNKQTTPATVFPEVPENKPDASCCGDTEKSSEESDVDSPAKDPVPTDHVTGAIGSTPSNPSILSKQNGNGSSNPLIQSMVQSIIPKDISIDIEESKKILGKLKEDSKRSPTVKGSATAFGPKEGFVPAAGDPDKDPHFVKGKRWTVKWENNQSK
jgi:hypothetical protein